MMTIMIKFRNPGRGVCSHGSKVSRSRFRIAQRPILLSSDIHSRGVFTSASPLAALRVSIMLVLYETAMGFALFKLTDSAKLTDPNLHKEFETPERANGLCVRGIFPLPRLFCYRVTLCTG